MTLAVSVATGLPAIGRLTGGGGSADWLFTIVGGNAQPSAAAVTTFYNAKTGGAQYTDLQDMSNSPISSVTTDSNGFLPQFQWPAGVLEMWADAHGGAGPRVLIRPSYASLLNNHQTYLKNLTG
jgi:hypothetical protein